jgi:hypothetical protein
MPAPIDFPSHIKNLRKLVKSIAEEVDETHAHPAFDEEVGLEPHQRGTEPDHDEMHANLVLAYRHLEDAAMRLGKAIQAYDGGKSVYDS